MKIKILATIALLTASITLQANEGTKKWYDGFYTGLGLGFSQGMEMTYSDGEKVGLLPNNILFEFYTGYELTKFLNVEINYSKSMEKNVKEVDSMRNASLSSDYAYDTVGMTLKPNYSFSETHLVFGILGINAIDGMIKEEFRSEYSNNDSEVGVVAISYKVGLGYEFKLDNEHSFLLDYTYNILGKTELSSEGQSVDINNGKEGVPSVNNYSNFGFSYKYTFR